VSIAVSRLDVLGFRLRAQQLDRSHGSVEDTAILDIGVQDSGPDGALWALSIRGLRDPVPHELASVWTIRGAPHVYRRADLPVVAAAVEPFSDADAGKRIYDAAKPLKAAGIANLDALDAVATAMRQVVRAPMVKGEVSRQVTQLLDEPLLRFCRPCDATHPYEMSFRLSAFRAGLELRPGTSPPVLEPIRLPTAGAGFVPAATVPDRVNLIRAYLRLLGPATPNHVAAYLDAPLRDVKAHWPSDTVAVSVEGQRRWVLAADQGGLQEGPPGTTRLLGPFDLFLQARDRDLLVPDITRVKVMWPVLGRPGAVLVDGEIAGMWRPRKSAAKLSLWVEIWGTANRRRIDEQAEQLAAHRGLQLSAVHVT